MNGFSFISSPQNFLGFLIFFALAFGERLTKLSVEVTRARHQYEKVQCFNEIKG
jgi:hypothetical protein